MTTTTTTTSRPDMRFRDYARSIFRSVDFVLALIVVASMALLMSGDEVRGAGTEALITALASGLAIAGIVLTAMTLLAMFLDAPYRRVLDNVRGGYRGALLPFKVVAFVAGLAAGQAAVGLFFWDGLSDGAKEALVISSAGTLLWAIAGLVQLVFISTWHGEQRARLLDVVQTARRQARQRRGQAVSNKG